MGQTRRVLLAEQDKSVAGSAHPDAITRTTATAIANAKAFRFDMSDLAPAAFGGTPGQGEWKILQDFLSNPKNVAGTASKVETAAAAQAYKQAWRRPGYPPRAPRDATAGNSGSSPRCSSPGRLLPRRLARLSDDQDVHPQLLRSRRIGVRLV